MISDKLDAHTRLLDVLVETVRQTTADLIINTVIERLYTHPHPVRQIPTNTIIIIDIHFYCPTVFFFLFPTSISLFSIIFSGNFEGFIARR